jgi:uracil phosphoribosyltransferase
MFKHRKITDYQAQESWGVLKNTVSREKAFQATSIIAEAAAKDMLEMSGESSKSIDRIYVKLRDGLPMATGMRKVLPNVDIRYIISQEKQGSGPFKAPISIFGEHDDYVSDIVYFADPMNATGNTASKSLRLLRKLFPYKKALVSHVAANDIGIKYLQTTLDEFSIDGYMNYAFNSKRLNASGYMEDGLALTPDIGDKLFGTLGSDYSIFNIQEELRNVIKTQAGKVELLNGSILHLIQKAYQEKYAADRLAQWMTKDWITAALQWYCAVQEFPFKQVTQRQVHTLINNLHERDFLVATERPISMGTIYVYSLTEDGYEYTSRVYLPVLSENGLTNKIAQHYNFLIHLPPRGIWRNIRDKPMWR